jgi:hypothetical protein
MLHEYFLSRRLGMGRVHIYWNSVVFQLVPGLSRLHMKKTFFHELWGIAVIFVKSQLSSKSLCSWVLTIVCIFIECVACMYGLYIILLGIGGSVIEEVPDWGQHMFAGQIVTFLPHVSKGVGGEGNLFWCPLNLTGTRHRYLPLWEPKISIIIDVHLFTCSSSRMTAWIVITFIIGFMLLMSCLIYAF